MKKIVIVFIASLFALIAFEIFLRYSPFEYGTSPVTYDEEIGMWHKRNFSNRAISGCYKTKYSFDEEGRPKNIYPYDKHKKDVILLGDSFIEAIMVENQNIVHNALAKAFNNKYNFMNYGLSRTGPVQQFVILKDKVDLNNTKYVIQFINLENDLMDADSKNLGALERPMVYVDFETLDQYKIIPPRKKTLYDRVSDMMSGYQIYFFIKKLAYYLKDHLLHKKSKTEKKSTQNSSAKTKDLTKSWLYIKGAIHQIHKYTQEVNPNIKYQLIITSENEKNEKDKAIIKKFLDSEHIKYLFLNDVAQQMGIKLETFKCDKHWTDSAHQNIAKIIKESGFVK